MQLIPHKLFKEAYQCWIFALLQWDEPTRQICINSKTMRGVKRLAPDTEFKVKWLYLMIL